MELYTLWTTKAKDLVRDILIHDVDLDGSPEVIVASWDERIYCLSGLSGSRKWIGRPPADVGGPAERVTIANLDVGRKPSVIASLHKTIVVFDGESGSYETSLQTNGWISVLKAADLDGDGLDEIIAGTRKGSIFVFDDDGELLLRKADLGLLTPSSLDVFDINFDGEPEIIVGGKNLTVLDISGDYRKFPDAKIVYSVAVGVVSPHHRMGVVAAHEGGIFLAFGVDETMKFNIEGLKPYSMTLGDYDGDGVSEIFVGDWASDSLRIFKLGSRGLREVKKFELGSNVLSIAAGDIDGDGEAEAIVFLESPNANLHILDKHSKPITLDSYPASLGISVGDATGYGYGDIVIRSGREILSLLIAVPRLSIPDTIVKGETFRVGVASIGAFKLSTGGGLEIGDRLSYYRTKASQKSYLILTAYKAIAKRFGTTEITLKRGKKEAIKRKIKIFADRDLKADVEGVALFDEDVIQGTVKVKPLDPRTRIADSKAGLFFSTISSTSAIRVTRSSKGSSKSLIVRVIAKPSISVSFNRPLLLKTKGELSISVKNLTVRELSVSVQGQKNINIRTKPVTISAGESKEIMFSYEVPLNETVKVMKMSFAVVYEGLQKHSLPVPFTAKVINDDKVKALISELKSLGRSRDSIIKTVADTLGLEPDEVTSLYQI